MLDFFYYYYNPVVPEVLFILFGNIFFLLKLGDFYYSFFELIETFLFHSPVDAYSQGFLFCLLYFSVLIILFGFFKISSVLPTLFISFFISLCIITFVSNSKPSIWVLWLLQSLSLLPVVSVVFCRTFSNTLV